jgi:hypothetical protein
MARRAILGFAIDEHAGRLAQAEIAGDLGGELRGLDADERMLDLSLLEQLVGHAERGHCRNREADGHRSLLRWVIPITSPCASTTAPPELPGEMGASVLSSSTRAALS